MHTHHYFDEEETPNRGPSMPFLERADLIITPFSSLSGLMKIEKDLLMYDISINLLDQAVFILKIRFLYVHVYLDFLTEVVQRACQIVSAFGSF